MPPKDDEFVPAGSVISSDQYAEPGPVTETGQLPASGDTQAAAGGPTDPATGADTVPASTDPNAPATTPAVAAKTPEELAAMVENAQAFIGRQSTEIGELRKQVDELRTHSTSQTTPPNPEANQDPEAKLRDSVKQFEDGKASLQDVIVEAYRAGLCQSEKTISDRLSQHDQQVAIQQHQQAYLSANPDFAEKYQSGALKAIMDGNPLHNDISAFEASKRADAESRVAELQSKLDALTAERDNALARGKTPAGRVISTPGSSGRINSSESASPGDIRASMLAAVQQVRGQQG